MLSIASSIAVLATVLSATTPSAVAPDSFPRGIGCTPETRLTVEVDNEGQRYISGSGKLVCDQFGPSQILTYLSKNSDEVARKAISSVETNSIAAVTAPCGPGRADWTLIVEYTDDLIGKTVQHKFLTDVECG